MRVYMLVYNNCTTDARVLKEAATLRHAGCAVEIVAVLDRNTQPHEVRPDGVVVTRIDRRPLHYRVLWAVRRKRRQLRLGSRRARRFGGRLMRRGLRFAYRLLPIHGTGIFARAGDAEDEAEPPKRRSRHRWTGRAIGIALAPLTAVSAAAFWTLMRFHKPLMYADWYWRVFRHSRHDADVDVVHAHDLNTLPVAALLARHLKAHLVFDAHELYPEVSTLGRIERRVWRIVESSLISRADNVLTVCDSIAEELVARHGIPRPRILLNCPENVTLEDRDPDLLRRHAGLLSDPRPIVLYQGGFAPNRGLSQLIQAASAWPDAVLVLMGWGMLEVALRDIIAGERLGDRVLIVPPVPREQLVAVAAGAQIGVIPYEPVGLNNRYTMPNKLFEYINALLPVAATDLPELRRVLLNHDLGRTFATVTPEAIGIAVSELLADEPLRRRIAVNARTARRHFSWEEQSRELVAMYASVSPPRV